MPISNAVSLVTEVLQASGKIEKEDLNKQYIKTGQEIEKIKLELTKSVSSSFGSLQSVYIEADELGRSLDNILEEASDIKKQIENVQPKLLTVVVESDKAVNELHKVTLVCEIVQVISKTVELFLKYEEYLGQNDYYTCSQLLDQADEQLKSLKYGFTDYLDVIKTLKSECIVKSERLKYELGKMWSKMFIWQCDGEKGLYKLSILGGDEDSRNKVFSFLTTLHQLNILENQLKTYGPNLMKFFIKPILTKRVQMKISKLNAYTEVEVKENNGRNPDPIVVFQNLSDLFTVLDYSFLSMNVGGPKIENQVTLARLFGKLFSEDFCQALVSEGVLEHGTLTNISESVTNLQNQLVTMKFLESDASVFGHTQNFNSIISNKICQEIFSKARETIKKDLHITASLNSQLKLEVGDENDCKYLNKSHVQKPFEFPECLVSSFMVDLVKQLNNIGEEARKSNAVTAVRLYFAARYVCELFCDIVPIYHQHNITMFPQQTAIHHNNCMYLANELFFLSSYWHSHPSLGSEELENCKASLLANGLCISFIDVSQKLKIIGSVAFLDQMKRQKLQLLEFLQDGSVFRNLTTITDFFPKAKKTLQQCLHQLSSLKQLWVTVLPPDVYLKAFGTLCNSVIEEIIFQISWQEDITEKVTEHLGTLFETIITEMPPLFQVQKYETISDLSLCQKFVSKWTKFQELKLLLVSSLRDIVDRWAAGAGPLGMVFSPEEVKQLIRALFQNTERRSVALAKIVVGK